MSQPAYLLIPARDMKMKGSHSSSGGGFGEEIGREPFEYHFFFIS